MTRRRDKSLDGIKYFGGVLSKLQAIEVRTLRQLYSRLQADGFLLRNYLKMSAPEFTKFSHAVRDLMQKEFPRDLTPSITPVVNKHGVAVEQLKDPSRPKYYREQG